MQPFPMLPFPHQLNVFLARERHELLGERHLRRYGAFSHFPRQQRIHAAYRTSKRKWCPAAPRTGRHGRRVHRIFTRIREERLSSLA